MGSPNVCERILLGLRVLFDCHGKGSKNWEENKTINYLEKYEDTDLYAQRKQVNIRKSGYTERKKNICLRKPTDFIDAVITATDYQSRKKSQGSIEGAGDYRKWIVRIVWGEKR